jgi:UDP-N-acetylglucosamine diphosphorylase/glucosamine-1-phosphate N-acetyltransferase
LLAVVILAAGKGKRMESALPKVLHPLAGTPLIDHVLAAAADLRPDKIIVIVGHERERVQEHLADRNLELVVQDPPLGTGHALMQVEPALQRFSGDILVLSGDVPLLQSSTLTRLVEAHRRKSNAATVLSCYLDNPTGYGRILRGPEGEFKAIVEEREASHDIKEIKEINSGIYTFESPRIFDYLRRVAPDNRKGEYYLTDVIAIMVEAGQPVEACAMADFREVRGINTRQDLREAEMEVLERRERPKKY